MLKLKKMNYNMQSLNFNDSRLCHSEKYQDSFLNDP